MSSSNPQSEAKSCSGVVYARLIALSVDQADMNGFLIIDCLVGRCCCVLIGIGYVAQSADRYVAFDYCSANLRSLE